MILYQQAHERTDRSSPVTTLARGLAKRTVREASLEWFKRRVTEKSIPSNRKRSRKAWADRMVERTKAGAGNYLLALSYRGTKSKPVVNALVLMECGVPGRLQLIRIVIDSRKFNIEAFSVGCFVSKHVIERLHQRYGRGKHEAVCEELLFGLNETLFAMAQYGDVTVNTAAGLYISVFERGRDGNQLTMITFVDNSKLRPEQRGAA